LGYTKTVSYRLKDTWLKHMGKDFGGFQIV
jgi:hypothetical protein